MKQQKQTTIQIPIPVTSSIPKMAYTPEETAEALGLGITNTRALIKTGKIKSVLIGKTKRLIPVAAIHEFLMNETSGTTGVPLNLSKNYH